MAHRRNLSINSVNSIIEPTTPPAAGSYRLNLWVDKTPLSASAAHNSLLLPTFNLDAGASYTKSHSLSATTVLGHLPPPLKIDKEYLISISKTPLDQLRPQIMSLAKDQYGCRFLQKKMDENVVSDKRQRHDNFSVIFSEVSPSIYELIIDPFGNYLVQKLVGFCSEANINRILESLLHNLFQISINQHGTRALQKIIDTVRVGNKHQYSLIVNGLSPYIIVLIKDLNGNHVIQKILNKYPPQECQFIYDSIVNDLMVVATHKHGCCVLQKCLNHVTADQLSLFAASILSHGVFKELINDQFGNYVLQYLISKESLTINRAMFNNFVRIGIRDLCRSKYSSNVVEKFLKSCFANEAQAGLMYDLCYQILISDLNQLINDPYGNYVVQTLIKVLVDTDLREPLVENVTILLPLDYRQNMEPLQIQIIKKWFQNCKIVSSFGKRIQLKINVILNGNAYQRSAPGVTTNMNSDGEFIVNHEVSAPGSRRSLSFNSQNGPMPYVHHQRGFLYPEMEFQPQAVHSGVMQRPLFNSTNRYVANNSDYVLVNQFQGNMPGASMKLNEAQNLARLSGIYISEPATGGVQLNGNQPQLMHQGSPQWYVQR